MTSEEIKEYTQRIIQSNRTELIVVLFDIYNKYIDESHKALQDGNNDEYKNSCHNASRVILHLKNDLDFRYPQSRNLYALYDYCDRCISKSIYSRDDKYLEDTLKVMSDLRESFVQLAQSDSSEPLMKNAEKITFGLTYDRNDVTGIQENYDSRRGFLV